MPDDRADKSDLDRLFAERGERLRRKRAAQEAAARARAIADSTKQAIASVLEAASAARTSEGHPQVPEDVGPLATSVVELAKAWAQFPGRDALVEHPLPDRTDGVRAGQLIFEQALQGADHAEIKALIEEARERLGDMSTDARPVGWIDAAHANYAHGIVSFFRQLDRFFELDGWNPPRVQRESPDSGVAAPEDSSRGTESKQADSPRRARPLREYSDHLVRWRQLATFLAGAGVTGLPVSVQDQRVQSVLPQPVHRTRGAPSWYRLGEVWGAARNLTTDRGAMDRLLGLPLSALLEGSLRTPDWKPEGDQS